MNTNSYTVTDDLFTIKSENRKINSAVEIVDVNVCLYSTGIIPIPDQSAQLS